ncbi:MAG: ubiquinone biosynthesis protein UbiH [Betaproteobacteria bacterium HGW-Betaproteobacteria-11]|nr:MAG: ubiquinone biosynthesis protein UbiH [Betaproteobacteria bacterium HGW-Betaproteobacteria-11]
MDFDIVIVGGGLAGLALAAGLRRAAFSVALVEGKLPGTPAGWDARVYAISPANARFLDEIGVWPHLDRQRVAPVRVMEVFGDGGGRLEFSAYDSGVAELAWILESSLMQRELWETAKRQGNLSLFCPARPQALEFSADAAHLTLADGRTLKASLVVAADGADSWTRAAAGIEVDWKPYDQLAVVANFATEKPHHGTAFQWFRQDGILAWLPLPGNRFSMVWSTPEAHGRELLALESAALCARVAAAGGGRLGQLERVTPAAGFPLRLMRAPRAVAPRLALIGDAAHTIHPLSGHGINLGFQDARALAAVLCRKADPEDCGELALLRRYERARKEEVVLLQTVTDSLQRLFRPASGPLVSLRNLGLNFTQHLPVVKDVLVRYALAS